MGRLRFDWVAVAFGLLLGLWGAADQYVGYYVPSLGPLPMKLSGFAYLLCAASIVVIGLRNPRRALVAAGFGLLFVAITDQFWKYAIHAQSSDFFKIVTVVLFGLTPIIALLGLFAFWRAWHRQPYDLNGAELTPDGSP